MADILDPTKVGGADLSVYEADLGAASSGINWGAMANAGVKFMYTRVSISLSTDGAFSKIWSESKGKLPRGGYHFLYPSSTGVSIRQQANVFANLLRSDPGELPPCVDVEYQGTDSHNNPVVLTASDVYGFITYLHEEFNPWPWKDDILIYTGYYYWKDNIASADSSWLKYKLWIAGYQTPQPLIPPPWTTWFLWQWTSNGDGGVYGTVAKSVDLDYFNGTEADFENYIAGVFQPNPTPTPTPPTLSAYYKVTATSLNIRSGPGISNPVIGVLQQNDIVSGLALSADGSWIQIRRSDGLTGWSSAAYLTPSSAPNPTPTPTPTPTPLPTSDNWYQVTAASLNIRSGSSTSSSVVGNLQKNNIVQGINTSADGSWIQISRFDGLTGWCSGQYLNNLGAAMPASITQNLYNGVTYYRNERSTPREMISHILVIDMLAQGFQFLVTPPVRKTGPPLCTMITSKFLSQQGLQIAVNGDGFYYQDPNTYDPAVYCPNGGDPVWPNGYAASRGNIYFDKHAGQPVIYMNKSNVLAFNQPKGNIYNALSGDRMLVVNGAVVNGLDATAIDPRTAIGVDKFNRWLILITVDGRETSVGATFVELANLMITYNAYTAMSLDGGGSSTMAIQGANGNPIILNTPIDNNVPGQERAVANHLGIFINHPIAPTPPAPGQVSAKYQVTTNTLNIRSGPGISNPSIGFLALADIVTGLAISSDGNWIQIQRNDGLTGWCSAAYLIPYTEPSPTPTPPPPSPPPTVSAYYQVTATALNIRSGPDTSSSVIGTVYQNEIVTGLALSADGSWIQIQRSDSLTGWCSAAYLIPYTEPAPTPPPPTPPTVSAYYQVTATTLNIRSGPGTSNSVIGTARQNDIVAGLALSTDGSWLQIQRSDGLTGWCSAAYLTPCSGPIPTPSNSAFTQLNLYPNIETAGVTVTGTNLPPKAQLMYRQNEGAPWQTGHPLMQIPDGRLVGSLFNLSPSTTYFVKVSDGTNEIAGSITTQPNDLQFTPSSLLYVNSKAAAGGNGSATSPFQTIQDAVNHAAPGTQIVVADGVYTENVTFPVSGTAHHWIQVKAAGNGAILDGSKGLAGQTWNAMSGINKVWWLKLGQSIGYLARDGQRFYNYDSLSWLQKSLGHDGKSQINEGWYYEASTKTLYVRSLDNPAHYSWQVPILNHAFDITGRDWIWIEGFEIRYYGTQLDGCGVCATNASHTVIRNNKIHNLQLGIFVNWNGLDIQSNDTRVENNEIYDPPVDQWPWAAVKGSSMEGTGIVMRGHIGAIVRGNEIHNINNGIYTGSSATPQNPEIAFDLDVYNNHIHNIGDDSQEPEGACVNHRFRNNIIDTSFTGVSIAPVTQGPTWVMRCLFTNILGTSIKWANNPTGHVLIYHNTSWINASGLNAMSTITPMQNTVMRNNIFQGNGFAFQATFTGAKNNDWDYDNWYTTRGAGGPHFQWEDITYQTIQQLCSGAKMECNGHEYPPGFVDPSGGDFTLLPTSPNIDRGVLIPGINDKYNGNAPDIGAFEF